MLLRDIAGLSTYLASREIRFFFFVLMLLRLIGAWARGLWRGTAGRRSGRGLGLLPALGLARSFKVFASSGKNKGCSRQSKINQMPVRNILHHTASNKSTNRDSCTLRSVPSGHRYCYARNGNAIKRLDTTMTRTTRKRSLRRGNNKDQ